MKQPDCTIDYFINKINKIPANLFCKGDYVKGAKRCVFGHFGERWNKETAASKGLSSLIRKASNSTLFLSDINDHPNKQFPQRIIKNRILAALRHIKEQLKTKK